MNRQKTLPNDYSTEIVMKAFPGEKLSRKLINRLYQETLYSSQFKSISKAKCPWIHANGPLKLLFFRW